MRKPLITSLALLAMVLAQPSPSSAAITDISINGFLLVDQGPFDTNPAPEILEFDSSGSLPWASPTGYQYSGTVDLIAAGAADVELSTGDVLRLTNFVAEAVPGPPVGQTTQVIFRHVYDPPGIPGPADAVAQIEAFSDDALAAPLAAGEDALISWNGFVNNMVLPDVVSGAPSVNLAGLNQPYDVIIHDGLTIPAGDFVRELRGEFAFQLGGVDNQFVLPSSAEVGVSFAVVPEPSAFTLAALGLLWLGFIGWRRRRR